MSKAHRGKPKSEEHKRKISGSHTALLRSGNHHILKLTNGRFKSGYHHSPKAGKVHYRSSYELAFYQQLDQESEVSTYEVEAVQIPYYFDGRQRTYIPDVLIHYTDGGQELVEIKPEALLDTPENDAKFEAAFKEYGEQFVIVTEHELS